MPEDRTPLPFSVAVRMPSIVRVGNADVDVISTHNDVIESAGCVAFAKFGNRLAPAKRNLLEAQKQNGITSKLYVVFRLKGRYIAYSSCIEKVSTDIKEICKYPAPAYYQYLSDKPSMAFIIASKLEPDELTDLRLESTKELLLDVLARTRTAMMLVYG